MTAPSCPICNSMMIERENRKNGSKFYGCSNYPKCKGMRPFKYEKREIQRVAMPTNVVGTPQQDRIWEHAKNSTKHLIIRARAGTGKTFSITHMLTFITGKIVFLAFNKHIVDEIITRVPENSGIEVKTNNGFGYAQVRAWNPKVRVNVDKLYDILKGIVPQDEDNTEFLTEATYKLVNLTKYNLFSGTDSELDDLVSVHGVELNDSRNEVYTYVRNALKESKNRRNEIDFTDQMWFIYVYNISVKQYDYVIVDELQDLNPLQHYVVMQASNNGKFIGVGDDLQAIYGFAGADVHSMLNLENKLSLTARDVDVLDLTYTRRCPVSHVKLANAIVPDLMPMDGAVEGTVEKLTLDQALAKIKIGSMGIARRNAPLISIAYKLIRMGIPVLVRGRDFGKGLQALISKMKAESIDELIDKLESYRMKEIDKLQKKGKRAENQIQILNDRIDSLIALTDGKDTIDEVRRAIETIFQEITPKSAVVLSSVHRAKGLESENVYVFDYARIEIPMSDPEFAQQEKNLHYIAITRSKNYLALVD